MSKLQKIAETLNTIITVNYSRAFVTLDKTVILCYFKDYNFHTADIKSTITCVILKKIPVWTDNFEWNYTAEYLLQWMIRYSYPIIGATKRSFME
jgi:hypothetical protein